MQVRVLGPLSLEADGAPVDIGGARLRSLLVRLAADAGSWVPVSRLVGSLWLDTPPADEVNALQSLVSRLRRALPRPDLIESGPAGYRLVVDRDDVDALAFESLVGQGRRATTPAEAVELLSQALRLWRGSPLAEVTDAPYAEAWVERLERLRLTAIDERADALLTLGRTTEPIADLEEVAAQHPLRERTHELLIRALAADGRQGEALAVYERLRRALADELGLDPPAALQQLQAQVLRDDAALRAPSVAEDLGPRRTNLRVPLTSFVGRQAEVEGITEQLGRARLVTLVGTGGAGKTRLAGEVAGRLNTRDGVWMVELAPVMDPDDVPSTVLDSIGSIERSQVETWVQQKPPLRDARARLVEALAGQDAVVVLDNCEHLIESCAELAGFLLARCPDLTVLATSREPLGIVGESIWPVRPLSTQASDSLDSPAVRLFTDRAALVRPGFTLTPDNSATVSEICRRLDGLPLAIELAAARMRTLGPEALAGRLDNRFRVLTGGNRTAMPRHQTLRAVVAWSWELLTDDERALAEQISVFPGGVTADTAAAVCSGGELDQDVVADLLLSLADKSLLVVTGVDQAQPRYRMLETIREFALEQLSARGEMATVRRAHASYFLALAETADPYLRGPDQLTWLDRLTTERENLLATLRFAVENQDADLAVRLAGALGWYWTMTSRHEEAGSWADQAIRVPGESPPGPRLFALIMSTISSSLTQDSLPSDDALDAIEELAAQVDLPSAHPLLAVVAPAVKAFREGMSEGRKALQQSLDHPDPWARAMLRLMSSVLAENEGDFEVTAQQIPQALEMFRQLGDRWGIATASSQLGEIRRTQGELDEAITLLSQAARMMTELRVADDEGYARIRIARLRKDQGDLAGARRDLEAAQHLATEAGSWMTRAFTLSGLASVAAAEGDLATARRLTEQGLELSLNAPRGVPQLRALMLSELTLFEIQAGDLSTARNRLPQVMEQAIGSRDMPVAARVTLTLVHYLAATDQRPLAAEVLGASAVLRGYEGLRDPDVSVARRAAMLGLDEGVFTAAYEKGRSLERPEALELATRIAQQSAAGPSDPAASS
ncbi:SARP family transcriptional regulator [Kineosporia sp. NBRC 101677]|uniref:BTAD domain-containing putative transcriptional regulator n=1 Tax=Kineosporia sp. NBRC 101677 TaxID=3032197 RepID=UPI0024A2B541|nr:BTAD domain-containing putative transcriptional regulator [Kineosporia sp. NBRC 101677]GLY19077.1 SARP family transcriptional regulator [Kineosporia sp. NBRC 101677]